MCYYYLFVRKISFQCRSKRTSSSRYHRSQSNMSNKSDDWRHSTSEDGGDCLFGKCKKCGPCQKLGIFGVFKSRFDCAICVFIFISLASLLLAVIGPLMLDVMINKVVDVEVVIDSPDAVNYEAWQSNAKPDSTVRYFLDFLLDIFLSSFSFTLDQSRL